ncbi:conserved hypothetical protein [Theileria orientalis strain Shintoku]|uniref:Uncharacterized protein n=1 Tax=Theileria orientalis strain Shintoku TaxID=869250 RepID=J4DPW1_THEOR|nr:conserved hypothetical protein [Theileria orientalis strain Shintoku]BAM41394.1 conserved hypothetical protein [Theileria orientalis strain Shintoku]|eukprot:XP_009691695.1 conserved hypothetical protein [Theileria orientalis strain Shintoku]
MSKSFRVLSCNILGSFSIIHVVDLNDHDYKKLCYELNTTGNCTTCKIKIDKEDGLIILDSSKTVWSSELHHQVVNLIVSFTPEKVELVNILFQNKETDDLENVYFYYGEEGFTKIDESVYHYMSSVLSEDARSFDVNAQYGDWFVTTNGDDHRIHRIKQSIRVNKVVDKSTVIWKNEMMYTVTSVKVKFNEDEEADYCEIFCCDKSLQLRYCYLKDDFGWHHINTYNYPVVTSRIKPKRKEQFEQVALKNSPTHVMVETGDQESDEVQDIIKRYKSSVLLISLKKTSESLIPRNTDLAEYVICGMNSKVYSTYKTRVSHVTDGNVILWKRGENEILHKVTMYESHDKRHILVELEILVLTPFPMKTVEGLKAKHRYNHSYFDYTHFIMTGTKWEECGRTYFILFMQNLVRMYMAKNPNLTFDGSFANFFESVYLPPKEVKIKKRVRRDSFRNLVNDVIEKLFVDFIPVCYDLKDYPFNIFNVRQHYFSSSFLKYEVKNPYVVYRIIDNDQVVWNQTENGLGCRQMFYFSIEDEAFLHLTIDAKIDTDKYYHNRKGYWHEVEEEEHISLINMKAKEFIGNRFLYSDNTYVVVEGDEEEELTVNHEEEDDEYHTYELVGAAKF